jgi:hypothetical protein
MLLHKACLKLWQTTRPSAGVTRGTSTFLEMLTNRNFMTGRTQIHGSFTKALFTLNVQQSGAFDGQAVTVVSGCCVHMARRRFSLHQKLTDVELVTKPYVRLRFSRG